MDFVAIDFETANEQRCSPCAIGLVVVSGGEFVENLSFLIRPPELRFSSINIGKMQTAASRTLNRKLERGGVADHYQK